jgi:pyridoxine 5-phosphate synthase
MNCKLSVNINKIATLRNARGGNLPDVLKVARDCEQFGAQGITVHPRPDQRHIRYSDVLDLCKTVTTEFNIEGYPSKEFLDLVLQAKPTQVTLVPDPPDAITSNAGWDTRRHSDFLKEITDVFHKENIRTSIFVNPDVEMVKHAAKCGCQRVELYMEDYAKYFAADPQKAIAPYCRAAQKAKEIGLELNAGHDLNLQNLRYFNSTIPNLAEVSIGHALICDALYYGLQNTIQMYLRCLS